MSKDTTHNDSMRIFIYQKLCHGRTNRQQYSIMLHLRRWIVEIWNAAVKCIKNIFSDVRRAKSQKSLTMKFQSAHIPTSIGCQMCNVDSERENTFWREGGSIEPRRKTLSPFVSSANYANNHMAYNTSSKFKQLKLVGHVPVSRVSYNKETYARSKRIGKYEGPEQRIADNDSSYSWKTDDEYCALYKKRSNIHGGYKLHDLINGNEKNHNSPNGDCTVEIPLRNILSTQTPRHRLQKKDKKELRRKEIKTEREKSRCINKGVTCLKDPSGYSTNDEVEGMWIETVCFGSVWYSKSELNTATKQRGANRSKQISYISSQ